MEIHAIGIDLGTGQQGECNDDHPSTRELRWTR